MSENTETKAENENVDSQSLDLNSLKDFSFGPQWSVGTQKQAAAAIAREKKDDGRERRSSGGRDGRRKPSQGRDRRKFDKSRGGPKSGRGGNAQSMERLPYSIDVYPEDAPFMALSKAMRASCKTYELFEIAQLILEKAERFVVVIKPEEQKGGKSESEGKRKLYLSAVDSVPFESEDEAISYTLKTYTDRFFDTEEIEVEGPKGSFPFVHKCGVSGDLIAPPNYHRYGELLAEQHRNTCPFMDFDKYKAKLVQAKEQEDIDAWTEKMKKAIKYTYKEELKEGEEAKTFDAWESARMHALTQRKNDIVQEKDLARVPGLSLEKMPNSRLKRFIDANLEKQKTFPLQTANNLRGRMRRMNFSIYKKNTVSYVCSVKRKFPGDGNALADNLDGIVKFIQGQEKKIFVTDFAERFMGLEPKKEGEGEEAKDVYTLTPEQEEQRLKLLKDLRWLVSEGFVIEYGDNHLFANAPLENAPKAKAEEKPAEAKAPEAESKSVAEETKEETQAEPEAASAVAESPEVAEAPVEAEKKSETEA